MHEEKGYLEDPLKGEFTAEVRKAARAEGGSSYVWLDRTYFYPVSGGQPDDRGTLGGLEVTAVDEVDGSVRHTVAGVLEEGRTVEGRVDMARRLDHMRQHTGQHLLSRVLLDGHGLSTVGFHLGETASTIDLDGDAGPDALACAERKVNELIMEDLPVGTRTLTREEYEADIESGKGTRSRLPEDAGDVRIVEIEGVDSSTCCGTHCPSTGMVGSLKITGTEAVRGGTRVEFLCGTRALDDYAGKHSMLDSLARSFSSDWSEVGRLVEKLHEENRSLRKRCSRMSGELASSRAVEMAQAAERAGDLRVVSKVLDDVDASGAREMASRIREEPGMVVLLATIEGPSLVFACTPGLDIDMGALLRESSALVGGGGGGGKDFAQGGGGDSSMLKDALDLARRKVEEAADG